MSSFSLDSRYVPESKTVLLTIDGQQVKVPIGTLPQNTIEHGVQSFIRTSVNALAGKYRTGPDALSATDFIAKVVAPLVARWQDSSTSYRTKGTATEKKKGFVFPSEWLSAVQLTLDSLNPEQRTKQDVRDSDNAMEWLKRRGLYNEQGLAKVQGWKKTSSYYQQLVADNDDDGDL